MLITYQKLALMFQRVFSKNVKVSGTGEILQPIKLLNKNYGPY